MIQDYFHLSTYSVDELLDIYLTNLYLYHSWKIKSSFSPDIEKQIDFNYMQLVEQTINVPECEKFRQTILEHTIQYDEKNLGFGIDSNPILGKAIRLFFDHLHGINCKRRITFRSIFDEWEPTCFQKS